MTLVPWPIQVFQVSVEILLPIHAPIGPRNGGLVIFVPGLPERRHTKSPPAAGDVGAAALICGGSRPTERSRSAMACCGIWSPLLAAVSYPLFSTATALSAQPASIIDCPAS